MSTLKSTAEIIQQIENQREINSKGFACSPQSTAAIIGGIVDIHEQNLGSRIDLKLMKRVKTKKASYGTTTRVCLDTTTGRYFYPNHKQRIHVRTSIQKELEERMPTSFGKNTVYRCEVETTWGIRRYIVTIL